MADSPILDSDKEAPAPKPAPAAPELAPEEGFRGWLCVVGGFICLFCTFGFLNAYVDMPSLDFQLLITPC